jgi:hypothetical protein
MQRRRIRFTLRSIMIAIAVVAVVIAIVIALRDMVTPPDPFDYVEMIGAVREKPDPVGPDSRRTYRSTPVPTRPESSFADLAPNPP